MSTELSPLDLNDDEIFVDELKPGTTLMVEQFTIDSYLAAGGFGITYMATDSLDRHVVIKECFPGGQCRRTGTSVVPRSQAHQDQLKSIVKLFLQEARSLARTNHPNIVGVVQVFEENNTAYMVMNYVSGRDLLDILQNNPETLEPKMVEGYLTKMLDAIKHVHELGILHRDISPDNIIVNNDGEPILIDFGAARENQKESVSKLLTALRVVKDGYSPQEFYVAGSEQTEASDLYSLAATFYHIATGELPPDSQIRLAARAAGEDDPYVPLANKVKGYSRNFTTALDKAMAILPRDRMQNAEEWLDALKGRNVTRLLSRKESAAAPAPLQKKSSEKKSKLPLIAGVSALAIVAIGGLVFANLPGGDEDTTAAVATTAPAATPATAAENSAAPSVDFFVAMDKDQPDLAHGGTKTISPSAVAPTTPPLPTPVPAPRAAPSNTTVATIPTITTQRSLNLPFTLATWQNGMIVPNADSPEWLTQSTRITTVNGDAFATNAEMTETLNTLVAEAAGPVEVTLGLADGSDWTLTVGEVTRTTLSNGLEFVTRQDGPNWITEVAAEGGSNGLRVGDVVTSYVMTWEELNGPTSMQDILQSGLDDGNTTFSFSINRDGENWIESFSLGSN